MENDIPVAAFAIGDFVRCRYTYYQFYYPYYQDEEDEPPHHGIVVEVDYAQYEDWPAEIIYVVFCTDRVYRFFVQEELVKLS